MLGKIQDIATQLDKKRVYTAIAALVIALASGHLMQRNVLGGRSGDVAQAPQAQPQVQQSMVQAQMAAPVALPSQPQVEAEPTPEPVAGKPAISKPETEVIEATAEPEIDEPIQETVTQAVNTPATTGLAVAAANIAEAASEEVAAQTTDPEVTRIAALDEIETEDLSAEALPDIAPATGTLTPDIPAVDDDTCAPTFTATAEDEAMVLLNVNAPCMGGEAVNFDHMGLKFSELLAEDGSLSMLMPALSETAMITVDIDGQTLEQEVIVPNMADMNRVALVWQGPTGLQLHALENGAYYGDPGHIWAENPGAPDRALSGEGGFVTVLGSTAGGFAADVYSYPDQGTVSPAISIEAQVLDTTCDTAVSGVMLRSDGADAPLATDIGMYLPGCDAVGEYLVLKNLSQDLTIAGN